ncbi:hypothetical protein JTE90_008481 [Oedothorax gibbosus]|uniref:Uncharacterized protein n=1 Tax=Oedothorax gibbosus TaxID=931172 RepID=A0AAV6UYQ7_9ARAC|nr:hypothetical protein JTE90_008481 [Oedothorax gibbosus]
MVELREYIYIQALRHSAGVAPGQSSAPVFCRLDKRSSTTGGLPLPGRNLVHAKSVKMFSGPFPAARGYTRERERVKGRIRRFGAADVLWESYWVVECMFVD